jgi:hypothetical protein
MKICQKFWPKWSFVKSIPDGKVEGAHGDVGEEHGAENASSKLDVAD